MNPTWWQIQDQLWSVTAESLVSNQLGEWQGDKIVRNLGLYETPQTIRRVLWMSHLFELIADVPGEMHQYGVQWGRDLVLWECLREIYEPGARGTERRIIGFDTFEGHRGSGDKDGDFEHVAEGSFAVPEGYDVALQAYLENRRSVLAKAFPILLVRGDVRETLGQYLEDNPGSMVALAYLDLDLYLPTLAVLQELRTRMLPGGIIAFDELNSKAYPGETIAYLEEWSGGRIRKWEMGDWCYVRVI